MAGTWKAKAPPWLRACRNGGASRGDSEGEVNRVGLAREKFFCERMSRRETAPSKRASPHRVAHGTRSVRARDEGEGLAMLPSGVYDG